MTNHTPLPFTLSMPSIDKTYVCFEGSSGETRIISEVVRTDDAEFIVKACNSYYAMVEALQLARDALARHDKAYRQMDGSLQLTHEGKAIEAIDKALSGDVK